jgi:uncharacterized protein (TIGR02246 family)
MRTRACLLVAVVLTPNLFSQAKESPPNANDAAVRTMLKSFTDAFNAGDAKGAAAKWTVDCSHVDRESGTRTEGRKAMQDDFEKIFKGDPKPRLEATLERLKFLKADVAVVEGRTTLTHPERDPEVSVFSGVIVKDKDEWLIAEMEESPVPQPTAGEALKELEWMIGTWTDTSDAIDLQMTVRWSKNKTFLIRSFKITTKDDDEIEGTQVIAWDPKGKTIRSWTFDSDGSFGEALWSKNDGDWLAKSSQTLSDGRSATGTYVIARADDKTMTVKLIGHEIDDEPQPAKPAVKLTRKVDAEEGPAPTPVKETAKDKK